MISLSRRGGGKGLLKPKPKPDPFIREMLHAQLKAGMMKVWGVKPEQLYPDEHKH